MAEGVGQFVKDVDFLLKSISVRYLFSTFLNIFS